MASAVHATAVYCRLFALLPMPESMSCSHMRDHRALGLSGRIQAVLLPLFATLHDAAGFGYPPEVGRHFLADIIADPNTRHTDRSSYFTEVADG